ncbi:MAG: hypothetical protein JNN08_14895 [Bryobacterales bacterium]|nr:hypothetical protein [Bryobacterales bacterium]
MLLDLPLTNNSESATQAQEHHPCGLDHISRQARQAAVQAELDKALERAPAPK